MNIKIKNRGGIWMASVFVVAFLVIASFFANSNNVEAAAVTCTSTQSGAWNAATTWINCEGSFPGNDDKAIISNTHVVSVNNDYTVNQFQIDSGGDLSFAGAFTLAIDAALENIIDGTMTGSSGILRMNGANAVLNGSGSTTISKIRVDQDFSFASSANLTINNLIENNKRVITNNGTVTVNGNVTGLGATSSWVQGTNAALNISGTFLAEAGGAVTATASPNTINYNGAAQNIFVTTYDNLTLSGSGAKTFLTGTTTVNSTLSMDGTATASCTGTLAYSTGALEYKGSAAQTTTSCEFPAASGPDTLIINNNNSTGVTLHAARTITNLTIGSSVSNSIFNDDGYQLTATGTLNLTSGTFKLLDRALVATTWPAFSTNNISAGTTVEYAAGVAQAVSITPSYSNLTFSGAGTKTVDSGTLTIGGNWAVGSATALNTNNPTVNITGNLTGSGAITSGSGTISLGGDCTNGGTFTPNSGTFDYSGAGQTVCPYTYNNLSLSGSGTKTLTGLTTVNGNLSMSGSATATTASALAVGGNVDLAGTASLTGGAALTVTGNFTLGATATFVGGAFAHNIAGNWINNGGTFTNTGSTINLNGTGAQSIGGSASTTFNNLTISNTTSGATASIDTNVDGVLSLSANPSATVGSLGMGANTLLMGGSATTVGVGDATGIIKRTTLVAGNEYTFGNQYTSINFRNIGTLPTEISFKTAIGSAPSWKADGIQRIYDIAQTGVAGSGSFVTLNLHYLDSELNGNTENTLVKWFTQTPLVPGSAIEYGRSNYNTTNNWVGTAAFDVALWPTGLNQSLGTLGDSNLALSGATWNGSISTVWSNPGNWTPNGIPSDLADVTIPDATTANDPTLNPALAVGRLTLQSGSILNGSTDAVVSISGGSGAWSNNGGTFNPSTSTVVFANVAATISGVTDFYSVTIDSGADLAMSGSSTMRIGGIMTNNGTWEVAQSANNTVEYNGAGQTVLNPNGSTPGYDNLILSGTGDKTMPATTLSILGDFSMSGTASATAGGVINTTGNFTIGANNAFTTGAYSDIIGGNLENHGTFTATGATIDLDGNFISDNTFTATGSAISIGGDLTNSSAFTATGSTITFDGTTAQAISGTTAIAYNNLTLNNSAGLTINNNETVDGALTLTSGNITTGANNIYISSTGSVSGGSTGSHVVGNLRKYIAIGATSKTFEIGDASNYTPVDVAFGNVTVAGDLTFYTTPGDHPNIGSSTINASRTANRYWTATDSGITFDNYSAIFNFVAGDLDGGADTADFIVGKYNAGWTYPTIGTRNATNTQITGETSFSDFQLGDDNRVPTASVPGSISQYTNGSGYVSFQTTIADADSNETIVKVEYSDDGGATWYDPDLVSATPDNGSIDMSDANAYQIGTVDGIDTDDFASVTLTIIWDTQSASNGNGSLDDTDQSDIQVRITPNDGIGDGTAQASGSFQVDNADPAVTGITPNDAMISDANVGNQTFYLDIDYSETMTGASTPIIAFTPDIVASGTLTLDSGSWTDTDTYRIYYDVADVNETQAITNINVTTATDTNGNTQVAYDTDPTLDVDTENPTITNVAVDDAIITDADAGNQVTVTVDFSEAMTDDGSADPALTFNADIVASNTLAFNSDGWTDADTYWATYDITDQQETQANVDITVSGAQDAVGNDQQVHAGAVDLLDVDMTNPTVTSVSVDDDLIAEEDKDDKFVITIDFSEAMNGGVNPTIAFDPAVATTLANCSGVWTDANTYTYTCDIKDNDIELSNIDINVSGARDAVGNIMPADTTTGDDKFDIDTEEPNHVKNLKAKYNSTSNTVKLTWENPGSGDIQKIYIYRGTSRDFKLDSDSRINKNDEDDEDYTDRDITRGKTYYYTLVVRDEAGNKSDEETVKIEIPVETTSVSRPIYGTLVSMPVKEISEESTGEGTGITSEGTIAKEETKTVEEGVNKFSTQESQENASMELQEEEESFIQKWRYWMLATLIIVFLIGIGWWLLAKK